MGFTWSETITTGVTEIKAIHWSELQTNIDFLKDNPSGCGTNNTSVDAVADATVDANDNSSANGSANTSIDSGQSPTSNSSDDATVNTSNDITFNGLYYGGN
jgi:hypothetical protein